jgi:hypothetical protein
MTTLNFTKNEIIKMVTKGSNRTINAKESVKMLNDISKLNEKDANTYLKLWSSLKWFNERMNGKYSKRHNRMETIVSCKNNSDAYINFLLQDVENTK